MLTAGQHQSQYATNFNKSEVSQESQTRLLMNQDLGSICNGDVVAINKSFDHGVVKTIIKPS